MKKMKLIAVIIVLCSVMVACNKEGQFNPKQKISQISVSSSYTYEAWDGYSWVLEDRESSNYVAQRWNWNGNTLESIDYYDEDGTLDYTDHYSYDGKQLATITWGGSGRYEFVYEKGKISAIEFYYGSTLSHVYNFTHEGSKVTKIVLTTLDAKGDAGHPLPTWLLNIPTPNSKSLANLNSPKGSNTYEYIFEWDGDNIKSYTYLTPSESETFTYSYDNKLNPMCGMWDIDEFVFPQIMSKNNVTRIEYRDEDGTSVANYTYSYQGNYPSICSTGYSETYEDERYSQNESLLYDYQ